MRISAAGFPPAGARATLTTADDSGELVLAVPGAYNLQNAAAAYAVGRAIGLAGERLRAAAGQFHGTERRFQAVAELAGVRIFDDYAHHPTEVAATLTAARGLAAGGRLVACFQPHLFTRTRDFATEFGQALALADEILVLGIYPSREDPLPGVTGHLVADAAVRRCPRTGALRRDTRRGGSGPRCARATRRPRCHPRRRRRDTRGPCPRSPAGAGRPMSQVSDATSRLQLRRRDERRRRARSWIVGAIALVLLIGAGYVIGFSPALAARAVTVNGAKVLSKNEVLDAAGVKAGHAAGAGSTRERWQNASPACQPWQR